MRIALLSEFVYPFHKGGAERRYYELATRLVRRGHEVHWFAMQHWPGDPMTTFEGINLHAVSAPLEVYTDGGGRAIAPALRLGWKLTTALRRTQLDFDVVDCSLYPFFHVYGARLVRPRTPLVVTWYEFWGSHWYEYLGWRGFFGKQVERLAAAVPQRIISVSDATTAALVDHGVARQRVVTVPLGVDTQWIDSIRTASATTDVVYFGRLKNHKNVDVLLRALALVKRERPNITCSIIGDGPEHDRLVQLRSELDLDHNIFFHGELADDEVISRVKSARLFAHPSTKEGGGSITSLEANASGVPVMAIDHPLGIDPTMIEEGRNGWWVEQAKPEPLAAKLLEVLSEPERLREMRRTSRAFAAQFDWDRIAGLCEDVYETVSQTRRAL
jgi:glycosyltransferase involved in cell wall biosynthesis